MQVLKVNTPSDFYPPPTDWLCFPLSRVGGFVGLMTNQWRKGRKKIKKLIISGLE